MRFYLVKDGVVNSGNWAHPENQQATCLLSQTFTSLVPMMSERQNGNGFWNMKTVDKCATLLMNELMKSSNDIRSGDTLTNSISYVILMSMCNINSTLKANITSGFSNEKNMCIF